MSKKKSKSSVPGGSSSLGPVPTATTPLTASIDYNSLNSHNPNPSGLPSASPSPSPSPRASASAAAGGSGFIDLGSANEEGARDTGFSTIGPVDYVESDSGGQGLRIRREPFPAGTPAASTGRGRRLSFSVEPPSTTARTPARTTPHAQSHSHGLGDVSVALAGTPASVAGLAVHETAGFTFTSASPSPAPAEDDDDAAAAAGADAAAAAVPHVLLTDGYPAAQEGAEETACSARLRFLRYYVSIAMWLPKYDYKTRLPKDVLAGLSIGAMLVPQAIAYSSIVGVPPMYGLATAFFPSLVYFLLGHSPVMTVGPEATTSMMLGQAVAALPEVVRAKEEGRDMGPVIVAAAAAVSLLAGIFTLILGLLRLGFVDAVFSRPALSGFVFSVGMLLLLDQIPKLLGLPVCTDCKEELTVTKIRHLWRELIMHWRVHWPTAIVGVSCVIFLFGAVAVKKRFPRARVLSMVPHIFVLVLAVTALSWAIDLESHGVRVLGGGGQSFPAPRLPHFESSSLSSYIAAAIVVAVLGFIETQLINRLVPESGLVSPNRELVALGTMHTVSSIFGGYAAFGSIARTRISTSLGTTSAFAVLSSAVVVLGTMLFGLRFFSKLPVCVPAALVFYVGTQLLETEEIKLAFEMRDWTDLGLAITVLVTTFFFNVEAGLAVAAGACLLLLLKQQKKPALRLLGRVPRPAAASDAVSASSSTGSDSGTRTPPAATASRVAFGAGDEEEDTPYYEVNEGANLHTESLDGVLIYQVDGPLFFANAEGLKDRTRRIEYFGSVASHPSEPMRPLALKGIIFDLTTVTSIDSTAAQVLREIVADYKSRDVPVYLVRLRRVLYPAFAAAGIVEALGADHVLRDTDAAVRAIQSRLDAAPAESAAAGAAGAGAAGARAIPEGEEEEEEDSVIKGGDGAKLLRGQDSEGFEV